MRLTAITGIANAKKKTMKLPGASYRRNLMLIYLTMSILFSLTMVNVPVKAQDTVKVYIVPEPPAYIPGEPVGTLFFVDVYIESPAGWNDTTNGIVGWAMNIKVDPAVLEPVNVYAATFGYWLFDFADTYGGGTSLLKTVNKTTGEFFEVSEQILSWGIPPINGHGAGGNGKLCRLRYKSLNETAYTRIDLGYPSEGSEFITFYYYVGYVKHEADIVVDAHYNQPSVHTLKVESTPIDGIDFTIDSTTYTTNCSVSLPQGSYAVSVPSTWMVGTDKYNFVEWEDTSTNPVRSTSLTSNMTITATYELASMHPPAGGTNEPLYHIALILIVLATATGLIFKRKQIIKRFRRLTRALFFNNYFSCVRCGVLGG